LKNNVLFLAALIRLQHPRWGIYSTFIAYSNKSKRNLYFFNLKNSSANDRNYFFFPLAGAAACPGFGRFAPYLERL
jgi:hypothetical protein